MKVTGVVLLAFFIIALIIADQVGYYRARRKMQLMLKREVPLDLEHLVERALADHTFMNTLRQLYEDPDWDINGGDLVEAIGYWAHDQVWLAVAELQAMLPAMTEEGHLP